MKIFTHEFVIYDRGWIFKWVKKPEPKQYEYGQIKGQVSRRHIKTGEVQFILWKAGEQGHDDDHWHRYDHSWWPQFKKYVE